jgi:hypothetical protein
MKTETTNMMNETHIGGDEMVFSMNGGGACSGGFKVNSLMMKAGLSPITTLQSQTGGENVSDLFGSGNLVIPSWLLSYSTMHGGNAAENKDARHNDDKDDESDEYVDDDLYNSLLSLVQKPVDELTPPKKSSTTRKNKMRNKGKKNGSTRRQKI